MAQYEPALRLGTFVGVLLIMAIWEAILPRRRPANGRAVRWFSNISLVAINALAIRLVFVLGLTGIALDFQSRGWGLFNNVALPAWLEIAAAFLLLDLIIYGQHVVLHHVPILWRLHMVHHADPDFDVTTGLRFHTLEIILSMLIKIAAIALLGAPALAVLAFEIVLNATSMFSHSNVRLPLAVDRWLRLVLVTPDMHRVHHSTIRSETNSNFGFNVPWWDFLFRTYRPQPAKGHERMQIGLSNVPPTRGMWLHHMLVMPVVGPWSQSDSPPDR